MVERHGKNPGDAKHWEEALMALQRGLQPREREPGVKQFWEGSWAFMPRQVAPRLVGKEVEALLVRKGLRLSMDQRNTLCLRAASALAQAYRLLVRRASGDYDADPQAGRFPPPLDLSKWQEAYEAYCIDNMPDASTRKRQEGVLKHLFGFLGHDRLAAVTPGDAQRWKDKRLLEVSRETVRKADLAHPRAFFAWCEANGRIVADPFVRVKVSGGRKGKKKALEDGQVNQLAQEPARPRGSRGRARQGR